jgi:hypothetical protein
MVLYELNVNGDEGFESKALELGAAHISWASNLYIFLNGSPISVSDQSAFEVIGFLVVGSYTSLPA